LIDSKVHTQYRLGTAIAAVTLALAVIACQIDIGGPDPPGALIPTKVEAASELQEMWQSAVFSAATTGQVMVLLNEIQLTSLLAQRMDASENPPLLEPQIYLRHDSIKLYGITERGPFKAYILIAITPNIGPDGELSFELTTAEFGPIPAPGALKDTVSAILTEAFTGTIGSLATGIRVTTIAVDDGNLAIVGELR
jgi:hypothetical protein